MAWYDSLGRGAAQGATAGLNDEAVSRILAALPGPQDPQGYSREYAAGSEQADMQNSERASNAQAAADNPLAYAGGHLAGGLPMALAAPQMGAATAAGRIAAGGLTGSAMGALAGAGHADGGDMTQAVGEGADVGGAFGAAGTAAREALPFVRSAMSQVGRSGGQPAVNGILPPRPTVAADMPNVPKAGRPASMKTPSSEPSAPSGRVSTATERPTMHENVDPKKAYRDAAARNQRTAAARGPALSTEDTLPTDMVPPPPKLDYKNAPPVRGRQGAPTVPAPADAQTMPAPPPTSTPSMRPTMMDLGPVRPTARPGSDQAYKDAVMQEIADSARRASM